MVIVQALPGSIAVFEYDIIWVVVHCVSCRQEPLGQQVLLEFSLFFHSALLHFVFTVPDRAIWQGYFQLPLGTGIWKCPFTSRPMLSYPQAGAYPEKVLHAVAQLRSCHVVLRGYAGFTAWVLVRKSL